MSGSFRNTLRGVCIIVCAATTVLCLLAAPLVPWHRNKGIPPDRSAPAQIFMIPVTMQESEMHRGEARWKNLHYVDKAGLHLQSSSIFQIIIGPNAKSLSFRCLYATNSKTFAPVKITIDSETPPKSLFSGTLNEQVHSLEVYLDISEHRELFMRVHYQSEDPTGSVEVDCVRPSFTVD